MNKNILDAVFQAAETNTPIGDAEALAILKADPADLPALLHAANRVRERNFGKKVKLCSIVNAKCGACSENCSFCAQSVHNPEADTTRYSRLDPEQLVADRDHAAENPILYFGIVTSGEALREKDLEQIEAALRKSSRERDSNEVGQGSQMLGEKESESHEIELGEMNAGSEEIKGKKNEQGEMNAGKEEEAGNCESWVVNRGGQCHSAAVPPNWCASLGCLTKEQLKRLKDAGLKRFHHNVETAESFFPEICSTHSYEMRLETVRNAKAVGLQVCCGGILGLGESREQRVEMANTLAELDVDSIPLNFLVPIKGTKTEGMPVMQPLEILTCIIMFRLKCPDSEIRMAAGRMHLRRMQSMVFHAGATGIMVGDLLTIAGDNVQDDLQMIRDLGLEPETCQH